VALLAAVPRQDPVRHEEHRRPREALGHR
jgi:hypothetical protein